MTRYNKCLDSVLIISDDCEVIDDIRQAFDIGMQMNRVRNAGTDADIEKHILKTEPDLVVLDLDGDGENGLELLTGIKSSCRIPVITLSFAGDETGLVKALENGSDGHVKKPLRQLVFLAHFRAVARRCYPETFYDRTNL